LSPRCCPRSDHHGPVAPTLLPSKRSAEKLLIALAVAFRFPLPPVGDDVLSRLVEALAALARDQVDDLMKVFIETESDRRLLSRLRGGGSWLRSHDLRHGTPPERC